ncbi:methyltransferase [Peteryoungia ipomoeae]|uniref:Methyltransferase n=1 Tax=Peteryoungia ipomoeae TaxID=1210932 RepID=A0A4S8P1H8_9HYPH|nr:methyltransferase [Peteryoungia ipomoeae]THV23778.1 methyltransferase [Peteryoungia ipomoeae]
MDTGARRAVPAKQPLTGAPDLARQAPGFVQALRIRIRLWRNRQIASPRFRSLLSRLPLLSAISHRKANNLFRLTSGFVHAQILLACVKCGLFEALEEKALTCSALALRCGLPLEHMQSLLKQARRLDLVLAIEPDHWLLTDAGTVLAADRGLREMIRHHEMLYRDLADPSVLFRSDPRDTELRRYWSYVREQDPAKMGGDAVAPYSALMRESQAMLADCILASWDFRPYRRLLDIGGGEGAFLAAVGTRYPHLRLALFDLPAVTDLASRHLRDSRLSARSELHGGDFSIDVIPNTSDCVTLIRILCDHDDDRAEQILSNLHGHLAPGTQLIIAEATAGESEGGKLAALYFDAYFAAMGSGRCRSPQEIQHLLLRSGFRSVRTAPTTNPLLATIVAGIR